MQPRNVKDVLDSLTANERKVLAELIGLERVRLAQRTARDMGDEIVKSLEIHIK